MPRTKQSETIRIKDAQKTGPEAGKKRRSPKFSWKTIATREVVKAQRRTKNLLAKEPVVKIVKHLIQKHSPAGEQFRITKRAFAQLHELASSTLVDLMVQTERVRKLDHRSKAIQSKHLQIARTQLGIECLSNAQIPCDVRLAAPRAQNQR